MTTQTTETSLPNPSVACEVVRTIYGLQLGYTESWLARGYLAAIQTVLLSWPWRYQPVKVFTHMKPKFPCALDELSARQRRDSRREALLSACLKSWWNSWLRRKNRSGSSPASRKPLVFGPCARKGPACLCTELWAAVGDRTETEALEEMPKTPEIEWETRVTAHNFNNTHIFAYLKK